MLKKFSGRFFLNTTVSNDDRQRIVTKSLEGHSVRVIVDMLVMPFQTINSIVKHYNTSGKVLLQSRGGERCSKLNLDIKEPILS
ncbi:hypothetical protein A0H76_1579 [Hepatospora eriocheir]|uniref:Uncharacterized protein n=1 Tax=Hepatospora eriocheir TaxID=1081669 RepID=A0A1X0QH35_9MICR|nr:hypothetical protein A0H76_1579 [Hepatospora eriocheir]